MNKPIRKKLFIDSAGQGAIGRRILVFSGCCYLFLLLPLLIARTINEPSSYFFEGFGDLYRRYGYFMTISLLMMPLIIYDVLKLSNRFVGPVFRLRREMQRLADGQHVKPLKFRDKDYWQELGPLFNRIAERSDLLLPKRVEDAVAESACDTADESKEEDRVAELVG